MLDLFLFLLYYIQAKRKGFIMKVSSNFKNLPLERKEEIRDIAISMNTVVSNYYCRYKYTLSIHQKNSFVNSFL